jgi:CheY-like chemotaxis protein
VIAGRPDGRLEDGALARARAPLEPRPGVCSFLSQGTDVGSWTKTGPRADEAQTPRAERLERRLRGSPRGTILVVDDDEAIRSALAEILELSGYEVVVAADGQEGVDLLTLGLEPHAIVLDLMMPRMDGWTFLETLREDSRFQDVPVVVMTAISCDRPPGADACLQKPFDASQLDREVARLCAH